MEAFYKITILVTIIFLILALTIIGILMGKKANILVYPPVANQCPDYWTYDGSFCVAPNQAYKVEGPADKDGKKTVKYVDKTANVLNGFPTLNALNTTKGLPGYTPGLSIVTDPSSQMTTFKVNFKDPEWVGGTCEKKTWASSQNIVWDGVTNFNSC
jgi:hypothetical protein